MNVVADQGKRVVIVVEDDLSVLRSLRRLIAWSGFAVLAFARPRAVLEADLPKSNACLVVDVYLPEMTGIELCQELAAAGLQLPTIIITGGTDEATRERTRQADAVAVLFKPFSREALLEALGRAFGSQN